jgi:hypothetical protein
MKRDLDELETDPPGLPPYVSRSTETKDNDQRRDEFAMLHPIFANLKQSFEEQFNV